MISAKYQSETACLFKKSSMGGQSEVLIGQSGWLFLYEDTNDFLKYQFCQKMWSSDQTKQALLIFDERQAYAERYDAIYHKFIVPEKSVVYSEYLPETDSDHMENVDLESTRPALLVQENANVTYLIDALRQCKPYQRLYFRGDSHPNYMGSYVIYRNIVNALRDRGLDIPLIELDQLTIECVAYDGDLFEKLSQETREYLRGMEPMGAYKWGYDIEQRINLDIKSFSIDYIEPSEQIKRLFKRPTVVLEGPNKELPKAVIFRDSTSQFILELLSCSFSRSVFVWHGGYIIDEVVEAEKPDIIIHIQAERFLATLPLLRSVYKYEELDINT